MLHRAVRIRYTYWSRRRGASHLQYLSPLRYPSTLWYHSRSNASKQLSSDGELPIWRRVSNGPAYRVRDGSVEDVTFPLADIEEGRRKTDEFDDIGYGLYNKEEPQPALQPETVRFQVQWRTYYNRIYPLDEESRASAHESLAPEREESLEFIGDKGFSKLRQQWDEMKDCERYRVLPRLLAGSLTTSAHQSLHLLQAIHQVPYGVSVLMDCLWYIKRVHWDVIVGEPELERLFRLIVRQQLRLWRWPLFRMRAHHLNILLEHCSTAEISNLLRISVRPDSIPNKQITLPLVDFFTRHGQHEAALHCFKMLPRETIHASEPEILRRCTNLLKLDFVERQGGSQNFRIFPRLLELGVRPDIILHTIVIQNASAAGMSGVAWDLFRYMQAEKLEINSVTCLVLLKDSFARQDVRGLNEILTAIHLREDLARHPKLVAHTMNIVRIICMYERKTRPAITFSHMLAVYDRAFSRNELIRLGIIGDSLPPSGNVERPEPRSAYLAFTIYSYVLAQTHVGIVHTLWLKLSQLIAEGDETVIEAARHPYLYDAFVLFYSRRHQTLPRALDVVQHMLDHHLCQPTEKTWTFMVYAFLRHEQHEAATEIRDMMSEKGVIPSAKAWERILERWPESDVAADARSALEQEARQSDPPLRMEGLEDLFADPARFEEALETPVAAAKSEPAYLGWDKLMDLRPPLECESNEPQVDSIARDLKVA